MKQIVILRYACTEYAISRKKQGLLKKKGFKLLRRSHTICFIHVINFLDHRYRMYVHVQARRMWEKGRILEKKYTERHHVINKEHPSFTKEGKMQAFFYKLMNFYYYSVKLRSLENVFVGNTALW